MIENREREPNGVVPTSRWVAEVMLPVKAVAEVGVEGHRAGTADSAK